MLIKKKLYIIGASGLGREMESNIDSIPEHQQEWAIQGYLHSFTGKSPLDGYPSEYRILGSWEDYPLSMEDYCLIAVTQADWKIRVYKHLKPKTNIVTFINRKASIGKFAQIGEGSIISRNCIICPNVKIGKMVFVNGGSQIGHDTQIGDYSTIFSQVVIGGGCQIGENVVIGSSATLIPHCKVGDNAIIGLGSVVIRRVAAGTTVFGNPAKVI